MAKEEHSSTAISLSEFEAGADHAIFAAKLDIGGFSIGFPHCEQFADYVAQFVTSNRQESDRLNSMLSMCLNEALEMAYRYHSDRGALWIEVRQSPPVAGKRARLSVITSIPVDESSMEAYVWCQEQIERPDAASSYSSLAEAGFDQVEDKTGLVELVLVHGVDLSIQVEPETGRVLIVISMDDDTK